MRSVPPRGSGWVPALKSIRFARAMSFSASRPTRYREVVLTSSHCNMSSLCRGWYPDFSCNADLESRNQFHRFAIPNQSDACRDDAVALLHSLGHGNRVAVSFAQFHIANSCDLASA
ncbi:MAG: hypothetical protein JWM21_2535 [Acidobacteria bacterium]|nr:hypothetical protein [Acidobacteriota bacterium]